MFIDSTIQNLFIAVFGSAEGEAWFQSYVASLHQVLAGTAQVRISVRHFHQILDGAVQSLIRVAPGSYGELARGHLRQEGLRALAVLRHLIGSGHADRDGTLQGEITGMVLKLEAFARMIRRILVPGVESPLSYTMTYVLINGGTPLYDVPSNSDAVIRVLMVVMRDHIGAELHTPQTMFADPITLTNDPVAGCSGMGVDVIPAGMTVHEARAAAFRGASGGAGAGAAALPMGMYGGGESGVHPVSAVAAAVIRTPERPCRGACGAGASAAPTPAIGGEAPWAPAKPRRGAAGAAGAAAPAVNPAYAQLLGIQVEEDVSLAHLRDIRLRLFPDAEQEQDITLVDAAIVVSHMASEIAHVPSDGGASAAEAGPECALCMQAVSAGAHVVRPGCCHNAVYCRSCACAAVRMRNTCPFCVKCMLCHCAGCNSYHHL